MAQVLQSYQPEQDACGAIPICGGFSTENVYGVYGNNGWGSYGYVSETIGGMANLNNCFTELYSVLLKLDIATSGTLAFTITPLNPDNDYDFAVYNMTNSGSCALSTINNSIVCNQGYQAGGLTGLTSGVTSSAFEPSINVNAGDRYLILLRNNSLYYPAYPYGNRFLLSPLLDPIRANGFAIDFNGSTATFANSSGLPQFNSVKNTCNKSQQISVSLSKPVSCNSIASDGSDFYITPGLGQVTRAYGQSCHQVIGSDLFSREVTVEFDALPPGNYWLHAQAGIDGNSLMDPCQGSQSLSDSIAFTVDPYLPIHFAGLDSPACQFLVVALSHKIICSSIASDGSDFKITGPSPVQIKAASPANCRKFGFMETDKGIELADSILIELAAPIKVDGQYHLISQEGTDNNTMIDSCSGHQLPGDHISFIVNSFGGALQVTPDTVLCKASPITLNAEGVATSWIDCGIDPDNNAGHGIQIRKELEGLPGVTAMSGVFGAGKTIFVGGPNQPDYSARFTMLFLASELREAGFKAGAITKLGWTLLYFDHYTGNPNPPPNYAIASQDIRISIQCVNNQSSIGSVLYPGSGVYHNSSYSPHFGFNEFALDSVYNWDGTSNLLIDVCAKRIGTGNVNTTMKFNLTGFSSTLHFLSNNPQVDACDYSAVTVYQDFIYRPSTSFTMISRPLESTGPYEWFPSGSIGGDTTLSTVSAFVTASTKFTVGTTDQFGCYLRDTANVLVSQLNPSINPKDTTICFGDQVLFQAESGTAIGFYSWLIDKPGILSCLTCKDPLATPIYTSFLDVVISDQYGCSDTLPTVIRVTPQLQIDVEPKDTIIKYGSSLQLTASGAQLYSWTPVGSLDNPALQNPVASPLEVTDYIVTGYVDGCSGSDTAHVAIDFHDHLFIPSSFSPNGDGKNDVFHVVNLTAGRVQEFRVYNRWGQAVYSSPDNRGWDGTVGGVSQDIGVYQYLIRVGFPDGNTETFKGNVSIVR
jgi:gliding motility-associated-like protein